MTTNQNAAELQKKNQLVFVEYERPTQDGHFITVVDSYRNQIGKIHKNYNEETRKYEYTSYDHKGNVLGKSEKLWELKNEFTNNRTKLLDEAHQRRLESKGEQKELMSNTKKENKTLDGRVDNAAQKGKVKTKSLTQDSKQITSKSQSVAQTPNYNVNNHEQEMDSEDAFDNREEELDDLRNGIEEDFDDHDLER